MSSLAPSPRGKFAVWWIENYLVHGEGDYFGKPFVLTEEQKRFVFRVYEQRDDGQRRYRRVLRGRAKGDGKTALAAALGCVELGAAGTHGFPDSPSILVAAASFEQADLVFGAARSMIGESPALRGHFDVHDTEILRKDGPGHMRRVAAAAGTNDGARLSLLIADELHEWVDRRERVHTVLANGLAKRADGWELNITTAGSDLTSLLGRLYEHGRRVEAGEVQDEQFLFDWLEAPADFDLEDPEQREAALRSCNPHIGEFVSLESRMQRYHQVPEFEFRRYYLNQWTSATEAWLPPNAWQSCFEPLVVIPKGASVVLGVDIGTKRDSTAIARLWKRDDGRVIVEAEVFTPTRGGEALELSVVEAAVMRNADEYHVLEVAYDKWAFLRSAQELEARGLVMVQIDQNPERMCPLSASVFEAIQGRVLAHDGDPVLAAHVQAGATKVHDRGWRLVKGKATRPIDALMAMTFAYSRILDGDNTYDGPLLEVLY